MILLYVPPGVPKARPCGEAAAKAKWPGRTLAYANPGRIGKSGPEVKGVRGVVLMDDRPEVKAFYEGHGIPVLQIAVPRAFRRGASGRPDFDPMPIHGAVLLARQMCNVVRTDMLATLVSRISEVTLLDAMAECEARNSARGPVLDAIQGRRRELVCAC